MLIYKNQMLSNLESGKDTSNASKGSGTDTEADAVAAGSCRPAGGRDGGGSAGRGSGVGCGGTNSQKNR
jgi:hypothetical protein